MSARAKSVGAWLVLVGLALAYVATRLSIEADFSVFLPRGLTDSQRLFVAQLQHGATSRLLLIALEKDDTRVLADLSRALAAKLE